MNIDDINAQIAEINYRLRSQNISVAERIALVQGELCPDINDLMNRHSTLNSEELDRLLSTLQVDDWYRENYSFTTPSKSIKEKPFFLQGDIYYFNFPEKPEYCHIIDCTNLPEVVKENLTKAEFEYLQDSFKSGIKKIQAVESLQDVVWYRDNRKSNADDFINGIPEELKNNFYLSVETIEFIRFAIEDLNLAIVTLKNTRDYQFVIFPASQAIEKLLKACLIEALIEAKLPKSEKPAKAKELRESFKTKYGHRLLDMLPDLNYYLKNTSNIEAEVRKFPYAEEMFRNFTKEEKNERIRNFGKSVPINPRYDVIEISSEQAVEVINATLNIFELVSEKFYTPLERVMYYPELEEGYAELEDDDSFFEE